MTEIKLYEWAPTRSQKCRWALLEAGLDYESLGNDMKILSSDELLRAQPLGKVPAAIIEGKPLFESSAIVTAVADLAPAKGLIGRPGTWERTLHDQWTSFAATELEMWAWSAMLNTWEFFLPQEQRVPAIVPQLKELFTRGAGALEAHLANTDYMIGDRFSVTDIIVGYAANLGRNVGFLQDGLARTNAYVNRLYAREHCTLRRSED